MDDKFGSIVNAAKNLGEQAQNIAEKAGNLAQVGADALRSLTDEINELLPAIRSAGYAVQGVDLDVALPPKVSVHCRLLKELSEDERAALLASLEGRKLVSTAVSSSCATTSGRFSAMTAPSAGLRPERRSGRDSARLANRSSDQSPETRNLPRAIGSVPALLGNALTVTASR